MPQITSRSRLSDSFVICRTARVAGLAKNGVLLRELSAREWKRSTGQLDKSKRAIGFSTWKRLSVPQRGSTSTRAAAWWNLLQKWSESLASSSQAKSTTSSADLCEQE